MPWEAVTKVEGGAGIIVEAATLTINNVQNNGVAILCLQKWRGTIL